VFINQASVRGWTFPEFCLSCHRHQEQDDVLIKARYVHTNLIAREWQRLSRFYEDVFGCIPVPPERHFSGTDLENGTGIPGAELHGVHLLLPGFDRGGPTLEIYSYSVPGETSTHQVNQPGFGHVAFSVDDVQEAQKAVIEAGGSTVGEIVTLQTAAGARVTWCYVRDPEGNILELQSWS
jgi:predicted enzyme related to lactoylglutathione lyase